MAGSSRRRGNVSTTPDALPEVCLHIDADTRRNALHRLRSATGHLESVLRSLEREDDYADVLKQLKAVQGALGKVNEAVLRSHVRDHVVTASQRGDTDLIVDELMQAVKYSA